LIAYRLHHLAYAADTGIGAAKNSGARWNSLGIPMIYASQSLALAMLEVVVNHAVRPTRFGLTRIYIPDDVAGEDVPLSSLPTDWRRNKDSTRRIGDLWHAKRRSLFLRVPSSLLPDSAEERNLVINPSHSDFFKIQFSPAEPFEFDTRLKFE
jgi:RES domain-containing protein